MILPWWFLSGCEVHSILCRQQGWINKVIAQDDRTIIKCEYVEVMHKQCGQ